jgi:hypothetical protein
MPDVDVDEARHAGRGSSAPAVTTTIVLLAASRLRRMRRRRVPNATARGIGLKGRHDRPKPLGPWTPT